MPYYNYSRTIVAVVFICILLSCNTDDSETQNRKSVKTGAYYHSQVISEDTLLMSDRRKAWIKKAITETDSLGDKKGSAYYHYFKGRQYELSGELNKALEYYRAMPVDSLSGDEYSLQQSAIFNIIVDGEMTVSSEIIKQLLEAINQAELRKGYFLYRLYDRLAEVYYTNLNHKRSLEYTELYFTHHPLKNSRVIRQRYFDISFLLASMSFNVSAMQKHLDSARNLAFAIKDSIQYARTYDYEAQLHAIMGASDKAVASSRKFYLLMKERNQLKTYVFNNLAASFNRNNQPDSAEFYYKEAIAWAAKQGGIDLFSVYQGLAETYKKNKDYKNAAIALDSSVHIYQRNVALIQAEKIEELRSKFQEEKKIQTIASLSESNRLGLKIMGQQRWIFFIILLLLIMVSLWIYDNNRKKLLHEKNDKLVIENERLLLEQKALQLQLNPHFIYNSIANLQGLISADKKTEADNYLVAFSKLMRSVLELNRQDYITLQEEIDTLKTYIDLQQMRFNNRFEYTINSDDINTHEVLIPPMLLQPFIENTIEHGFKKIDFKGFIGISIQEVGDQLHVRVFDNGKVNGVNGNDSGKKSLSQTIIKERLSLLFKETASIEFKENGIDKGYLVDLYIPLMNG